MTTPYKRKQSSMNTKREHENRSWMKLNKLGVRGAVALLLLLPVAAWADGVVTNCTEAALRAAMAGGGVVAFACDGTITLASTITNDFDLTLDGSGRGVTISGGGAVRVFYVSTNIGLTLINLTIANGLGTNGGGGVYNASGTLSATNCTFLGNGASPSLYPFTGEPGFGGAIYNAGVFNASGCTFSQNWATGGHGSIGLRGDEYRVPASGGPGGSAAGGALCNAGVMVIDRSTFAGNSATGGQGGQGGDGIDVYVLWAASQRGGNGGNGGDGNGGAIFNSGSASVVNSTVAENRGTGGSGGVGGWGGTLYQPGHADDFLSGNGGNGGSGFGAICDVSRLLRLTNCTIAANSANSGSGGRGGYGTRPGQNGTNGSAAGGIKSSGSSLINTILAGGGGNCSGTLADLGHNLSSDGTCSFTGTGSMNNTDPKIGPLANNGGPTLTIALLPGSPAIDAADPASAPATDQRGIARPVGPASDIGAFEYGLPAVLHISGSQGTGLDILVSAYPGLSCRLLASSSLSNWMPMAANQLGTNGTVLFHDDCTPGEASRFYRVVTP